MNARLAVAWWLSAVLLISNVAPAAAQADAHARALARDSCQNSKHSEAVSETVVDAQAAVEHDPNELGPRMRLADALVDQGCYQEAVTVLEAVQDVYPRNAELAGKLRNVRSLVTEQTYIEGLTRAAEGAKLARNLLRCTRLADVTACDDALKSKPGDLQLLVARGDALMQSNRVPEAVIAYRHASQQKPGDEALQTKLAAAEGLEAKLQPAPESPSTPQPAALASNTAPRKTAPQAAPAANSTVAAAPQNSPARPAKTAVAQSAATQRLTATPVASVAALEPGENKTYSNEAPEGRTN